MSGEYASNIGTVTLNDTKKNTKKSAKKVDINILLSKIRDDQKKEKFENTVLFGLVAAVVVVTGIIISL